MNIFYQKKAFKGTVVNRPLPSLDGGSLRLLTLFKSILVSILDPKFYIFYPKWGNTCMVNNYYHLLSKTLGIRIIVELKVVIEINNA